MAMISGYNPKPGVKNPARYPFTGNNYNTYGEQPGFIYDPYSDQYYKDPNAVKNMYQQQGVIPKDPKQPSLAEQLLPIAGVGGALYAGQALGKEIPGLFGIGEAAKAGTTAATTGTAATSATTGAGSAISGGAPATPQVLGINGAPPVEATGMFDLAGVGSAGNVILPAVGAVGAYDLFANDREGVRAPIQGALSGAAMGSYFGPTGIAIGAGIGLGAGVYKGFFDKPSIKEQVKKRWGNLAESGDPQIKAYAQQYLQYLDSDQAKADAQKDFGEMKANGQVRPEDVWGAYDIIKNVGSEWLTKYNEDQRRQISQKAIDEGLFESSKGDIRITNPTRFKEIANQVLAGQSQNVGQPPQQQQNQEIPSNIQPIPRPVAQPQANQPTGMLDVQGPQNQQAPAGFNPKATVVGNPGFAIPYGPNEGLVPPQLRKFLKPEYQNDPRLVGMLDPNQNGGY